MMSDLEQNSDLSESDEGLESLPVKTKPVTPPVREKKSWYQSIKDKLSGVKGRNATSVSPISDQNDSRDSLEDSVTSSKKPKIK